ncbi:MAG: phosphotransferase [Myxococcales bacterium]|nr:phosphotransferase [Myxococcales bacterium]
MHGDARELRFIARATGATRVERGDHIQTLWSGYGELYRVHLHGADSDTAVIKSVKPPRQSRASDRSHARKCKSYDVELAWYRTYAARSNADCRVPSLIAGEKTDVGWLFVLEDLDAAGFSIRQGRGLDAAAIDRCLAWLAAFHARFLNTPPEGLWKTGTYWHLATRPDELAAIEDAQLRAAAPHIDAALRAGKFRTLVHGDAKLANFCFGDGAVAAVDFQYVGGGCGMSDVAYFLGSWSDDGSDPEEQLHLDAYFAHLRRALAGQSVDADALEAEWRALYPIAAVDFYRFLAGWAKSYWAGDTQGQRVVRDVLRELRGLAT